MLDSILTTTTSTAAAGLPQLMLCTVVSLALGVGVALIYMFRNTCNKSFVITLALLPVMVQTVIMLVNGNLGAGVAVMGAFSLVRFRSIPGNARDIGSIFFAMAIGLATGMGYLTYAALFLLLVGAMTILLLISPFGKVKRVEKSLKITIPENLDYNGIFDDLFSKYADQSQLVHVKTTNMGSLYELCYHIHLKDESKEKEFLDQLRCRNGNLQISCGMISTVKDEL